MWVRIKYKQSALEEQRKEVINSAWRIGGEVQESFKESDTGTGPYKMNTATPTTEEGHRAFSISNSSPYVRVCLE